MLENQTRIATNEINRETVKEHLDQYQSLGDNRLLNSFIHPRKDEYLAIGFRRLRVRIKKPTVENH